MQGEKTTPEYIVPEEITTETAVLFTFKPGSFTVHVRVQDSETIGMLHSPPKDYQADMTTEWANMPQENRDNWNTWFKKIMAEAMDISMGDVTGDLWPDPE